MTPSREEMELAAKLAGLRLLNHSNFDIACVSRNGFLCSDSEGRPVHWNPLRDDGDCLRLAVVAGIKFRYHNVLHQALAWSPNDTAEFKVNVEDHNDDKLAATRLAVFRAAVAIGRAM